MLVSGEVAVDAVGRIRKHGVEDEMHINWSDLMAFKRSLTGPAPGKHEQRYAEQGVAAVHGLAQFTGPNTAAVGGPEMKRRHVLIATGARPGPVGSRGNPVAHPVNVILGWWVLSV
jgi:glutathione reductase (NADPH)